VEIRAMDAPKIRRARADDAEAIAAIYAPFVAASAVSFETESPDAAAMRLRVAEIGQSFPWLVAEGEGRIAGYAYASRHAARSAYQWSADVTIYLHADLRSRGLGKRLYAALFAVLRRQRYRSLYAGITLPNEASFALHRAMGMTEVGVYRNVGFKLGAWRDVAWLGLSFEDDRPPSGPPTPFDALPPDEVAGLLDGRD
jgi:L-amino acid N-acyltransferase YncA